MNILMLDLEGCFIDNVISMKEDLINIELVNNFIDENKFDKFIIFSHAIDNSKDAIFWEDVFNKWFSVKFNSFTTEDVITTFNRNSSLKFHSFTELLLEHHANKVHFLLDFAGILFNDVNITLIDDMVKPCKLTLMNNVTINILRLEENKLIACN